MSGLRADRAQALSAYVRISLNNMICASDKTPCAFVSLDSHLPGIVGSPSHKSCDSVST